MEQLQSANKEKDKKIALLEEENSKVVRELESLRQSVGASATPVLNHCSAGTRAYNLRGKNSALDRSIVTVKKESSAAQLTDPLKNTKTVRLLLILFVFSLKICAFCDLSASGFDSVVL